MALLACSIPEQIPLPARPAWQVAGDVSAYAEVCLRLCGLEDWHFCFDRAFRRLGCCKPQQACITLSLPFVEHYLQQEEAKQGLIYRVLLHELAHALAWARHRASGHGAVWKKYCSALGIAGERSRTQCENFEQPHARYALIHQQTREVLRYYIHQPRISPERLKNYYIPKQKATSIGQLVVVPINEVDAPSL